MYILIPSYEPDERLPELVRELRRSLPAAELLVVDDGSGPAYAALFEETAAIGCTVLTHPGNRGKGAALKTGFRYLAERGASGAVVCADSDGQHLPADIRRVAERTAVRNGSMVLGIRRFTGRVPIRSRFGNAATRWVYRWLTARPLHDTQTGLRGYPAELLPWLCQVPGERFEYEMNALLAAQKEELPIEEVPIDTVYLQKNESSHFRPVRDSVQIYSRLLKFGASSITAALLDFILTIGLTLLTSHLLFAVVAARICSAGFNYAANRRYVFGGGGRASVGRSMPRYAALAAVILGLNYACMHLLYEVAGMPLVAAKLLTEGMLFLFSYWVQRRFVYTGPGDANTSGGVGQTETVAK